MYIHQIDTILHNTPYQTVSGFKGHARLDYRREYHNAEKKSRKGWGMGGMQRVIVSVSPSFQPRNKFSKSCIQKINDRKRIEKYLTNRKESDRHER